MMEPEIERMLRKEELPENVVRLMGDIKKWMRLSREKMRHHYPRWERNLRIFQGMRYPDENDMDAENNDEPAKMTVPMSYTQVMTFVTFAYTLYRQNPTFFMMSTTKSDEYSLQECCEDFLERDLRKNNWNGKLFQLLLDVTRMGVGCTKTVWDVQQQWIKQTTPPPAPLINAGPFSLLQQSEPLTSYKQVTKFEGNNIITVSPFRLLPDLRLPMTRWREGRFVADEFEFSRQYLMSLDQQGQVAGVKYLHRMTKDAFEGSARAAGRFEFTEEAFGPGNSNADNDENNFMVITTEGQFKIIPSEYGLGPETHPCDFIICLANDERIIKIERAEYVHDQFIYDVSQFSPDVHMKLNRSLCDSINALQDVITWLINARVLSVRRGLQTHAVVDPAFIDIPGNETRSPLWIKKKGSPMQTIDKFFMQLKYVDPTTSHFNDADILTKIMMTVSGVNENAMGQYAPGRRSAAENRAANQGAAARMVLHAGLIWEEHLGPLGCKMLLNQRQGVSEETFQKVIGKLSPTPELDISSMYQMFCPPIEELVGSEDFFTFDGTTQTDRTFTAQALQELVEAIASNPEMSSVLNFDINRIIDQLLFYRGIRNVERFKIQPNTNGPAGATGAGPLVNPQPGPLPSVPPTPAIQSPPSGRAASNGAGDYATTVPVAGIRTI